MAWLLITPASAESIQRVALLPKVTLSGEPRSAAPLEAVAAQALAALGARLVDLPGAMAAQRLSLSDAVRAGQLPGEATVLQADALLSVQLDCDPMATEVLGTKLVAVGCSLSTRAVRTETGDVLLTHTESLVGHGLSPAAAITALIAQRLGPALGSVSRELLAALANTGTWSADVLVSDLPSRERAHALAARLEKARGVRAARLVLWRDGAAKYSLEGSGGEGLAGLGTELSTDAGQGLNVVYETPRSLELRFDLARTLPRPIVVTVRLVGSQLRADLDLAAAHAALGLVPYLQMVHSTPILEKSTKSGGGAGLARAKSLGVPFLLELSLERAPAATPGQGGIARAAAALIEPAGQRRVIATSAQASGLEEALSATLQEFDRRYRALLPRADSTAVVSRGEAMAAESGLVVDAFRLLRDAGGTVSAEVAMRNPLPRTLSQVTAFLEQRGRVLGQQIVGELTPGAEQRPRVSWAGKGASEDGELRLRIAYLDGDLHREAVSLALLPLANEDVRADVPATLYPSPPPPALPELDRPAIGPAAVASPMDLPQSYSEQFDVGVRLHLSGEWEEARAVLHELFGRVPNARVAGALGQVEFDLGDKEEARKHIQLAVSSTNQPLTPVQRRQYQALLGKL